MSAVVVDGNPRTGARTQAAAIRIATALTSAEPLVVELASIGPRLFDAGDPIVAEAVAAVRRAEIAVIASPTYKATYTGLLKLFLDQFATGTGLAGVVAVPLLLGGGPQHSLAVEVHLRPLLAELGATVPAPGLFLLDSAEQPDPAESAWLARWAATVQVGTGVTA